MLTLYTEGYGFSKRLCEDVVCWFVSKHLPRHKLEIEVLHRGLRREYVHGYCSVQDCDWRPRDFLIEIQSNLSQKDYIQTLFHELYHCYQHIKGDLRDIRGIRCWKGMKWDDDDDYDRMPWEIEAYQKEKELYEKYLNASDATNHTQIRSPPN